MGPWGTPLVQANKFAHSGNKYVVLYSVVLGGYQRKSDLEIWQKKFMLV